MMGKMRTIMFCLPESGKFGQDSFKSLVVRRMIRKQADTLGSLRGWLTCCIINAVQLLMVIMVTKITAHQLMQFNIT